MILGKLDEILAKVTRVDVAGPVAPGAAVESEELVILRKILALLEAKEGTGQPPVTVTEGVVGEFLEYKPWHSTAGADGIMYGNPGQPKLLLGNWQYDALYRCAQSGTFLTLSLPGPAHGDVAKHITVLPDVTFWVSIATGEIPKAPIPVVLSDLDVNGNRVIQRISV